MALNETSTASPGDTTRVYITPASSIGMSDSSNVDGARNTSPISIQAQSLLQALESFVVPLVLGATGDKQNQEMIGRQFLSALQTLIATIIHDFRSNSPNRIEVALEDKELDRLTNLKDSCDTSSLEMPSAQSIPSSALSTNSSLRGALQTTLLHDDDLRDAGGNNLEVTDNYESLNHPNAISELRLAIQRHVFNKMPIRLLCFEPSESTLQITLVERSEIYERIASNLQMHEAFLSDYELTSTASEQQSLINFYVQDYTRYGILSHTWIRAKPGEVTYADWKKGPAALFDEKPEGYQKLVNFCKIAMFHNITFGWMDSVCINKESSAELDESIRSMYQWFQNSSICVTYLAKTRSLLDMADDPWFTRGWTLQELLAPKRTKFYNTYWQALNEDGYTDGSYPAILSQIELATQITKDELGITNKIDIPISRKMQWAAKREVTREEDAAYCLMGIFGVSISTAYGEGSRQAFMRLIKEILATYPVAVDIFNWAGSASPDSSSLLPHSPSFYLQRSPEVPSEAFPPIKPITLTHLGLRMPILLMPALSPPNAALDYTAIGDYYATIDILRSPSDTDYLPYSYNLLDKRIFEDRGPTSKEIQFHMMFGILNFGGDINRIWIPRVCLAIAFVAGMHTPVGKNNRVSTDRPIVFQFNKSSRGEKGHSSRTDKGLSYYSLPNQELESQRMQLLTIYI